MRRTLECLSPRLGRGNQRWDPRKRLIQEPPPGKLRSPSPVPDRRTEQKAAPPAIRTPTACHQELRAARAGLLARGPDINGPEAGGGVRTGSVTPARARRAGRVIPKCRREVGGHLVRPPLWCAVRPTAEAWNHSLVPRISSDVMDRPRVPLGGPKRRRPQPRQPASPGWGLPQHSSFRSERWTTP
jgi:hypothetical protein